MIEVSGYLTLLFLMIATFWYCPLILSNSVRPAPSTWIIACLSMNLALFSYHMIPGRTLIENVTLYVTTFSTTIIVIVVLFALWQADNFRVAFDWIQKLSLLVMIMIVTYWIFNKEQNHVTFWVMQALLIIAYLATIAKAIKLRKAFDSIGNWVFIFIGSLIGSIPAFALESHYGIFNSIRAVVSSCITMSVLFYFDYLNQSQRLVEEVKILRNFYKIR